jgi:Tfp pilus assembly protein PilE
MKDLKTHQKGFTAIEGLLVLVMIIAALAIGFYVKGHNSVKNPTSSSSAKATTVGTTDAIDQITQQDAQAESSINAKYDASDQSAAASTNSAESNLGGSYDEASL